MKKWCRRGRVSDRPEPVNARPDCNSLGQKPRDRTLASKQTSKQYRVKRATLACICEHMLGKKGSMVPNGASGLKGTEG